VKLGTSTGTVLDITTESSYDERKLGPVERFSSAASQVATALMSVPIIAPFAKASNFIFMGVKTLSSIFGWSKPVETDAPSLVKNQPFQNGAVTVGYDTNKRIVFDPKQELYIDPRVTGSISDDMVISEISRRQSYLTTFIWDKDVVPMSQIWGTKVNPMLHTWATGADDRFYYQPTACAFATAPFDYWNGSLKFKFEIVASSFHRGKILILFEPNLVQSGVIAADLNLNKNFLLIVDIQETQTFEFCVNWASSRYWQKVEGDSFDTMYGSTFDPTAPSFSNGCVIVAPFTTLQSNDDSNIEINVYVSCDDLRVNYLDDKIFPQERHIRTESGSSHSDTDVTCFVLNKSSASMEKCSEYHFGEEPVSFRSALKRYTTTERYELASANSAYGMVRVTDRNFPRNWIAYGSTIFDAYPCSLFTYLRYAYLGTRGGIRKRVSIHGLKSNSGSNHVKVSNGTTSSDESQSIVYYDLNTSRAWRRGTVTFIPTTNAGIEYEAPYYSNNLFMLSFADNLTGSGTTSLFNREWNRVSTIDIDTAGEGSTFIVSVESAAGEDFSFMRYQGAPYFSVPAP